MAQDDAQDTTMDWPVIAPSPRGPDAAMSAHAGAHVAGSQVVATALAGDEIDLFDRDAFSIDEQLDAVAKAALKRKRHRDIVARSRMRQKATIDALRTHETVLCKRLNHLLVGYDHQRNLAADDHEIERAVAHRTHTAYVEQVGVQERIRQENEFLQDRIDDLAKFRQMIESEWRRNTLEYQVNAADSPQAPMMEVPGVSSGRGGANSSSNHGSADVDNSSSSATSTTTARGYWIYFRGHEEPIYYEPLSVQSCERSMQTVYQRMIDLYQDFSLGRIALQEMHCFGWKVQRPLRAETECDRRLLRFQFTKTVRCVDDTMDDIVQRTWLAFHNPALFAKIYSTVVVTRVVQRVNEHMTVLVQNAPNPEGLTNIRYFNILAKMTGYNENHERVVALVKTIVDPTKINAPLSGVGGDTAATQPHDIEWMRQGFSFLLLSEVAGGSLGNSSGVAATAAPVRSERFIKMHYGTHYECVNETQAQYLMLEVLGLASRWEQLVLPTHHLEF